MHASASWGRCETTPFRQEPSFLGDILRVLVFLSGRGSNFRAIWDYFHKQKSPQRQTGGVEICGVISDKKQAPGLAFAKEVGLATRYVPRGAKRQSKAEYFEKLALAAQELEPNLIALAGFMRVLDPSFVNQFAGKIINIHPSLLPAFRGLDAQGQALSAGVAISGATVHFVTAELDAGPIICQAATSVLPTDTQASLSERILRLEHIIYPKAIEGIACGGVKYNGKTVEYAADFQRAYFG